MKRRYVIGAGLLAAGAGLYLTRNPLTRQFLASRNNEGVVLTSLIDDPGTCVVTPEQIEGPFFFPAPDREDIREDRDGITLKLDLTVVQAADCAPVAGARAEVWHCDAAGRYSAYPENLGRRPFDTLVYLGSPDAKVEPVNGKTYLRGSQHTDAQGHARFTTIFPGWYEPRATHIHLKVFVGDQSYLTTQLYFPDNLVNRIYSQDPHYAPHGLGPYNAGNDAVLGFNTDARGLLLAPREEGGILTASMRVALA